MSDLWVRSQVLYDRISILLTNLIGTVMGILYTRLSTIPGGETDSVIIDFGIPYFSISLALNVILTFMIVVRLVLHTRNFQNTTGAPARATRLYKTIVTILVESCSLYAISFILFIGPWWGGTLLFYIFWPVLTEIQVCGTTLCFRGHPIMTVYRLLPPSSSFYESPTELH